MLTDSRMFTSFLILLIPPTIVNAVVPKFYQNMALWQARELPSRIYGWVAFCTAQVVAEIPIAIASSVLYWLLWYYPTGLPTDSSTAGYVFLMTMLFYLFVSSWGQWICAFAPSFTVISNVLPFFFVMFGLFNGVVRPYADMPVFWRYWMVSAIKIDRIQFADLMTVLCESIHILDRRRPRRNTRRHTRTMPVHRDRDLRRPARSNMLFVRRNVRLAVSGLLAQPGRYERMPVLSVLTRERLPGHDQYQRERQVERFWHLPGVLLQ